MLEKTALLFFSLSPVLLVVSRGAADAALGIVSLLFLLHCFVHKTWQWIKDPYLIGFGVLWAWLFVVSSFAVIDMHESFARALTWGRFIPLVFAAKYWLLTKESNRKFVWSVLAIALTYTLVDLLVQRSLGTSIEGHAVPNFRRLTGPFTTEVVGTYMAKLGMVFIGGLMVWPKLKTLPVMRYLMAIGTIVFLFALAVLFSGERIAILSLGLAIGVFILCMPKYRKPFGIIAIVFISLLSVVTVSVPTTRSRVIQETLNQVESFSQSHYGMIFDNARRMTLEHPITGVGLKNYRLVCQDNSYKRPKGRPPKSCGLHPHNTYLEWAAEAGLVGLVLFVVLMGWIIKAAIETARALPDKDYYLALGSLTALIPFLWPVMSSMSIFTNWNAVLFWFVMAWVFSYTPKKVV